MAEGSELSKKQLNALMRAQSTIDDDVKKEAHDGHGHGHGGGHAHGHGEKAPSIVSAFISATINFALMFGLCCAYGNIMFQAPEHAQLVGLGVKMNLCSGLIMGVLLSAVSKVNVAIGGPDLNPVMFIAEFIKGIDKGLDGPLAPGSPGFDEYLDKLRATTIFATALSSLIFAALFFFLGKNGLTKYITFMPAAVVEAFLSCVGYKVFKYALKFCKYKPTQFLPAAIVGVSLYFMKAFHIGNPAVVIPSMLGFPLIVFYIIVFGSGSDLEKMRKDKWMFPTMTDAPFYDIWAQSLGKADMIDISAWTNTIPDLIIMIVVILLDCMLKIAATEEKLPIKPVNKDYEIKLYGLGNIFVAACGSSVAYMQLKFNVINFGILGNLSDKRGGFIYAGLCGFFFFVPGAIELFNYLPRLFLGLMLFFAGTGFVVENLWGSRKVLTVQEWMVVIVILIVFIVMKSLLIAVIIGCLMTGIMFIATYAGIPCIVYQCTGDQLVSSRRNVGLLERKLKNFLGHWVLIIRLKGYVFFGSAAGVTKRVLTRIEQEVECEVPAYARLKFVIFECQLLDGMDASGAKALRKLNATVTKHGGKVFWCGLTDEFAAQLVSRGICEDKANCFYTLDESLHIVEDAALKRGIQVQQAWHKLDPQFNRYFEQCRQQQEFEPFSNVLLEEAARHGIVWNFCKRETLTPGKVLWGPGVIHRKLYLIQSGVVAYFHQIPGPDSDDPCAQPHAIFRNACFINDNFLSGSPSHDYAICLAQGEAVVWDQNDWWKMKHDCPVMAEEIAGAVIRSQHRELQRLGSMVTRLDQTTPSGDVHADMDGEGATSDTIREHNEGATLLSKKLRNLVLSKVLGDWGLFDDPGNDSVLPDLPAPSKSDLQCAFKAYSANGQMSKDDIQTALRYAGIFASDVQYPSKTLSQSEFMEVGHGALMARISKVKLPELQKIFKQHLPSGKEAMGKEQFLSLFYNTFKNHLTGEEADRLIDEWDLNRSGEIDEDEFAGLVSRLVQIHRSDWLLHKAIQVLIGGNMPDGKDITTITITADHLKAAIKERNLDLHDISPEELVWVTDSKVRAPSEPQPTDLHAMEILSELLLYHCPDKGQCPLPPCGDEIGKPRGERKPIENPVMDASAANAEKKEEEPAGEKMQIATEEAGDAVVVIPDTPQAKLYLILEVPSSSTVALVWAGFVMILIFWVIVALILEAFDVCHGIWFEIMMTSVFVLEFGLRWAVCDALGTTTKMKFIRSPMNICDAIACLPFFLDLAFASSDAKNLRLLRMVRLIRLARFSRLQRYQGKSTLVGPVMMVLTIIWGIFYKEGPPTECS